MGSNKKIFQSLKDKIYEFKGLLKNKSIYRKHDFTKASTIKEDKIIDGQRNVDMKRNLAENNYLTFFDEYCKTKSISDIIDMITGKNIFKFFSNNGEINDVKRAIDSKNRKSRQSSATPSKLTIDDLIDNLGSKCFLAIDEESLNPKTQQAYQLLASETQAIYRILSFINSNIQGIYNKCDPNAPEDSPNSLKKFQDLLKIVKSYAKNYSSYHDFYLTDINEYLLANKEPDSYNKEDILSRAYEISQIRCNNLVNENINSDIALVRTSQEILKQAKESTENFVSLVRDSQKLKKENVKLNESLKEVVSCISNNEHILQTLQDVYAKQDKSCEKNIQNPWIGTGADSDVYKKGYQRQYQFKNALEEIAKDYVYFAVTNSTDSNTPSKLTNVDGTSTFTENDCKLFHENGSPIDPTEGINGLISIIKSYQNDDEVQDKQNILKVYSFENKEGKVIDKLFTETQMKVISEIYKKLKDYYNSNGSLKEFAYKSATHSIPEKTLDNLQASFEEDFKNNTNLENLNLEQIELLHDFIRENEPVKGLFTKDEIVKYEIDSRLIYHMYTDAASQELLTFMNLKVLENSIVFANHIQNDNRNLEQNLNIQIQANNITAENVLIEAVTIRENLSDLVVNETAFSQDVAKSQQDTKNLISSITEEMSSVSDYASLETESDFTMESSNQITTQETQNNERLSALNSDAKTLAENSNKSSIVDLYKKYLSQKQKDSFATYIKTLDQETLDYLDAQINMY